jgi:hypothetical protein
MHQNPFDLIWVVVFFVGCLSLPVVGGLIAVLIDRE